MPENEFEKKLKKMMDDFHLPPSTSVWENVSRRLHEKRRRKIPFFFLLAAGLITAGYFTYHVSEKYKQNSTAAISYTGKNADKAGNYLLKDSAKLSTQKPGIKKEEKASVSNTLPGTQQKIFKNELNNKLITVKNSTALKDNSSELENDNAGNNKQHLNGQIINENNNAIVSNNETLFKNSITIKQPVTPADAENTLLKDEVQDNNLALKKDSISGLANQPGNSLKKSTTKTPVTINKTSNWQWGVTGLYAKSNLIENLTNLNIPSAQYSNDPLTSGNYDTAFKTTHAFSPSAAYAFGTVVKKKIFKNGYLSSGLNFIHLSVKADIGKTVDSVIVIPSPAYTYFVRGYAQPGFVKTNTSKYNFIELPVLFQQNFFHSKKTSLSYNAGFSVRQLISSSSLIYNQINNIYFSKEELLRKTQFQVAAGLSFEMNTGKNNSFFIGPQFTYSLSNLIKNPGNSSFHFINYGLQAGFLLHKK